ncbi:GRF-interacting factor 10-like [Phragmites australis]|uniref:GRF-interacting factor 10-like n=1 Tax=Phragmites australis TaxID=29695 RepID=UPI002D76DC71|nr:GRF-interacting factor 10-like [Phragmites australis]
MAAEGEVKNPSGGGDNPQEAAVVAAAGEEAVQEAGLQGTDQEPEGEKADGEGKEGSSGAGEKEDGACRDLVLVEDPEVVAVEDPEEAAAAAALQEEMKALVASIPDGAGAAFTAMQLQELEQQSRVYQYMAARVPVPTHLVFPIWKSVTGASSEGAQKYPTLMGLATLCLDFGKNTEPEPGRCRRTDGKKWRCWRSTIPNEKYCERHMHRGRKRPVQLVVEDDEPDSASGSKPTSGKVTEGAKKTDDKTSSNKKLAVAAPAAVEST